MIIGRVKYDEAGRLLAPMPIDLKMNLPQWNSPVTLEAGLYHRIRISAKTEAEMQQRIRATHELFQSTPRLSVLSIDRKTVRVGSRVDLVLDTVYVVEAPAGAPAVTARQMVR